MKLPYPDYKVESIYDITLDFLMSLNIKLILLDIDNTIQPFSINTVDKELIEWVENIKGAGIKIYLFSNNLGHRPRLFSELLKVEYMGKVYKPRIKKLRQIQNGLGIASENVVVIGDQVYTDVLCAKRAGVKSILVKPIHLDHILHQIRFALESPFRK